MDRYIAVIDEDGEQPIELPVESDGTLLLSTLVAQFPSACGLKYRNPETNSVRGIRLTDGRLCPPDGDWGEHIYITVYPKGRMLGFVYFYRPVVNY